MSQISTHRSNKSRHRVDVENEMIRRREKEQRHMQTWGGQEQYYKHWEKANTKFDEWTSPRYYDTNNKMLEELKSERDKQEKLEKRRDKLKKLYEEEQKNYAVEMMVMKSHCKKEERTRIDDIPTEVLKDLNLGLKLEEEDRRRHEAEINLYHKWRTNNPILREYERKYKTRDLKLSWLDQQIEKRMKKEKDEEECRKILREHEDYIKKQAEEDKRIKKEIQEKNEKIKACLEKQMEEVKKRQEESDELRKREEQERRIHLELAKLEDQYRAEERKRLERECALYNLKQYKLKLREKLKNIQESLEKEHEMIEKIKALNLAEHMEDEQKKKETKRAIIEFAKITKEQQELEKLRQKHLEFCFDSEAKVVFEKQSEIWKQEELSRSRLLKDVLDSIKIQIEQNLAKNKAQQIEVLKEREKLVEVMEEYDKELEELKRKEEDRQRGWKKILDEDVKIKSAKKKQQESLKLRKLDEDLEKIKKEEERLRHEIMNIQKRQLPVKPSPRNSVSDETTQVQVKEVKLSRFFTSNIKLIANYPQENETQVPEISDTSKEMQIKNISKSSNISVPSCSNISEQSDNYDSSSNHLQKMTDNNEFKAQTRHKNLRKSLNKQASKGFTIDEVNTSIKMLKMIHQKIRELTPNCVKKKFKKSSNAKKKSLKRSKLTFKELNSRSITDHRKRGKKSDTSRMKNGIRNVQPKESDIFKKLNCKSTVDQSKPNNKIDTSGMKDSPKNFHNITQQKECCKEEDQTNKPCKYVENTNLLRYNINLKGFTPKEVDKSIEIYHKMQNSVKTRCILESKSDKKLNLKKLQRFSTMKTQNIPKSHLPESHAKDRESKQESLRFQNPLNHTFVVENTSNRNNKNRMCDVEMEFSKSLSRSNYKNISLQVLKEAILENQSMKNIISNSESKPKTEASLKKADLEQEALEDFRAKDSIIEFCQNSKTEDQIKSSNDFSASIKPEPNIEDEFSESFQSSFNTPTYKDHTISFQPIGQNYKEIEDKVLNQDIKPCILKDENDVTSDEIYKNQCSINSFDYCSCASRSKIKIEDKNLEIKNIDESDVATTTDSKSSFCNCCFQAPPQNQVVKTEAKTDYEDSLKNILVDRSIKDVEDIPKHNPVNPKWHPPRSPHNLIEEILYHDPWALLVATIFLNKTSCSCARPYILEFLKDYSSPFEVLRTEPCKLEKYFVNLGLKKRSVQVWRMSYDFVNKNWKNVTDLYGIGKYGEDAYRMFCIGDLNVQPKDRFLKIYKAWYEMTEKKNRMLEANESEDFDMDSKSADTS